MDEYAKAICVRNMNMMVAWWLMASYAYYVLDTPIVSDGFFDNLSQTMLDRWDSIRHDHKKYISRADLEAGSGYAFAADDYPGKVIGAVEYILALHRRDKHGRRRERSRRRARRRLRSANVH